MKKEILVVDDSQTIFKIVQKIIGDDDNFRNSIIVKHAVNGFDCIISVVETKPDLILMDYSMPKLNGFDATSIIKSNDDYKDIPIVFFSSLDNAFDKMRGMMFGASDYLGKQKLKKEILIETINRYLTLRD